MNRIDHRHIYFIVIDTETCGDFGNSLTYDNGWSVIDSHGNVYAERSFVVTEIFDVEKRRMASAYYANKLPQYYEGIPLEWAREHFAEIHRKLAQDVKDYNVKAIIAHNASFDVKALNNTCDYLFGIPTFFDFGIPVLDSLKMAKDAFLPLERYVRFCEEYGFMTKHATPRPRLTAEVLYRFMTNNPDYEEQHTGLEDTRIEREIFIKCRKALGMTGVMACHI